MLTRMAIAERELLPPAVKRERVVEDVHPDWIVGRVVLYQALDGMAGGTGERVICPNHLCNIVYNMGQEGACGMTICVVLW